MIVTEIKKIGKGRHYSVDVDGEFFAEFDAETLAKSSLKTGDDVQKDKLLKMKEESDQILCFDRALSKLEHCQTTEKELVKFLKNKGYNQKCIDLTIEKLKSYNYINDETYVENFIKTYLDLRGEKKIKYDLILKGVDKELVEEKMAELVDEESQKNSCLNIAKKYVKNKVLDAKTNQKLLAHLLSKGFSYDIALKTVKDLGREDEGWN